MDLFGQFSIDNASHFTVKLIIFLVSIGYVIFTLLMSRQIGLMNRVLNTPTEKLFGIISSLFILGGVVISVLTFLSLFG